MSRLVFLIVRQSVFLSVFFSVSFGLSASEGQQALNLWQLSHKQATIYILGVQPMMRETDYPLAKEVETAFREADKTIFQVDLAELEDVVATSNSLKKHGIFAGDTQLDAVLDSATRDLLIEYFAKNEFDIDKFQTLKPWVLSLQVHSRLMASQGFSSNFSLEKHFQRKARILAKPVNALETFDAQLAFVAADSIPLQVLALNLLLKDAGDFPAFSEQLRAAWQAGDVDRYYRLNIDSVKDHPKLQGQWERTLDHRNRLTMGAIRQWLRSEAVYFLVVDFAQLGGRYGLLALLEEEFKVRQIYTAD